MTIHALRVWNDGAVYQHGSIEVAIREHLSDVMEVAPDRVPAFGVLHIVGADVNHAAVIMQLEMMGGFSCDNPMT
jgi:hypothetical protein